MLYAIKVILYAVYKIILLCITIPYMIAELIMTFNSEIDSLDHIPVESGRHLCCANIMTSKSGFPFIMRVKVDNWCERSACACMVCVQGKT